MGGERGKGEEGDFAITNLYSNLFVDKAYLALSAQLGVPELGAIRESGGPSPPLVVTQQGGGVAGEGKIYRIQNR